MIPGQLTNWDEELKDVKFKEPQGLATFTVVEEEQ
jgi:hypothetical protein